MGREFMAEIFTESSTTGFTSASGSVIYVIAPGVQYSDNSTFAFDVLNDHAGVTLINYGALSARVAVRSSSPAASSETKPAPLSRAT